MTYLSKEEFETVIEEIKNQVFGTGKGAKRHGSNGVPLEEQTWAFICKTTGSNDFCVGQAIKKATELKDKPDKESYDVEILGAIIYLIFAKMWQNKAFSTTKGAIRGKNREDVEIISEKSLHFEGDIMPDVYKDSSFLPSP